MYGRLITFNDQGMRGLGCCGRRGLRGITGAQAFDQAKSAESNLDPRDYQQNQNFSDASVGAEIENSGWLGFWSNPGGPCSGQGAPKLNLFSTASGLALGTTGAGIGIASSVGAISAATAGIATAAIAGVGAIVALIAVIYAHHAAAVKQEDQLYCAAMPAAANAFQLIQQAVQNGTQTPEQASTALDELLSQFEKYIAPSYGHSPYCNALCEQKIFLDAVVRYWKGQYAEAVSQPGMTATGAPGTASAPDSGSNIVLGIAAALAVIFVGRALV